MDNVRKNKHLYPEKLEDIELSSVSTSNSASPVTLSTLQDQVNLEAIKSSLVEESAASASMQPYDLSVLVDTDLSDYPAKVPAADNPNQQ